MKLKTKFQDEDFDLGEVVEGVIVECLGKYEEELRVIATAAKGGQYTFYYNSIKEFTDDWEDYEEPKGFWMINILGIVEYTHYMGDAKVAMMKSIGNYFETEEEAEKAAERLRALERLKDKGFKFKGYTDDSGDLFSRQVIRCSFDYFRNYTESRKDLELLFFGEDD